MTVDAPSAPVVSIVIPTYNRLDRLAHTLSRIRTNVTTPHEIIIVDGGSTDGTREFLADANGLRVILEPRREGAVRAFNRGFRAALGTYVMWLNDDAHPLPGGVEAAVAFIERFDHVGMVAFYHDWNRDRNVLDSVEHDGMRYSIYNVRGYPYANFGLLRRTLLQQIGYADERYYFFAFDPDMALKIQLHAGLKVVGCRDALVHHDEYHDDRKWADLSVGQDDNAKLFAKWNLPAPNTYPDPAPAYQAMIRDMAMV
ncbi:MAG: glycosyltransferase family 2 protein [Phycisphaerales bacterium]|nr:glycosyltransferase family 2 protein [Phycisphaerales bacterium]